MAGQNTKSQPLKESGEGPVSPGDADLLRRSQAEIDHSVEVTCEDRIRALRPWFDWKLDMKGGQNAVLTLFLRIYFQRVDPTAKGGFVYETRDLNGTPFKLREITDQEFIAFREYACRVANDSWNSLCLVTPNDFTKFDLPKGPTASVRPNVNCLLDCDYKTSWIDKHAWVWVVAPISPRPGVTFRSFGWGSGRMGKWDIRGAGAPNGDQDFWQARRFPHLQLRSLQPLVVHEVGHLLGVDDVGVTMKVKGAEDDGDATYGVRTPWLGRDIMGAGTVIHACDASPWMRAMGAETCTEADRWIPAGVQIPPRPIQNIPKQPYTLQNSPYQGGFQERGRY
jgi:hypothetical protein